MGIPLGETSGRRISGKDTENPEKEPEKQPFQFYYQMASWVSIGLRGGSGKQNVQDS
jgi:hypothetical protein